MHAIMAHGRMSERANNLPADRGMSRAAFTLIELLVVMAILGILAGLLIPAVTSVLDKAAFTKCKSNMRQIGIALAGFQSDHDGRFPVTKFAEFRGGDYELYTQLADYLPFGTVKNSSGNPTEWIDPDYTCPLYRKRNRSYAPDGLAYGSYAYRHAFQGDGNPGNDDPPTARESRIGGWTSDALRGDPSAGAWSIYRWSPSQYGVIWDNGWDDATPNTTPHDYDGIPAHDDRFNVLMADLRQRDFRWVHENGVIPNGSTPNVPPELRDDQYGIAAP